MSRKSKHKPVTLAKSAAEYDRADVIAPAVVETVEVINESLEIKVEDAPVKVAKAAKSKPIQDIVHDGADVTAIYRTMAERALDQARQTFTKARTEALTLSDKLEESSTALTAGSSAVQSYVVTAMQAQADDAFGYFRALAEVKTLSDAIMLQSTQSRKVLDASLRQFKDLSSLMNDMVVKASTPIKSALPLAKS
jgi:hypothetical protein